MRILLACEESQAVCKEFRKCGHEAYSCDILPCSGGHPEWHIEEDAIQIAYSIPWDIMIGFPPCTHLAVSGAAHFEKKRADGRQQDGIEFFMKLVAAPIEKIAIENPISIMSSEYRMPDQIVHPYYFGDPYSKATCLWLKNLPPLFHVRERDLFNEEPTHVDPIVHLYRSKKTKSGYSKYSFLGKLGKGKGHERSKFPEGIAKAMAEQWGKL